MTGREAKAAIFLTHGGFMENSKTALPDYRRLFSRIDEKGLARILELALDRQLIVKLLHICGLVRDGRDLATTAMHTLAA